MKKDNSSWTSKILRVLRPSYRSRANYWSSSKLATWLKARNGIDSPSCLSSDGWADYKTNFETKSPLVYWFTEEFLNTAQGWVHYIPDMIDGARVYIVNGFLDRTHTLGTKLQRGQFYEFNTRLTHAAFEALVDFIEVEKAWSHVMWASNEERSKYEYPKWYYKRYLRWFSRFRCPEAGLDHLKWELSLTKDRDWLGDENHPEIGQPTPQAESAKEQLELYTWWKETYPNRPDPYEVSGWSAVCDRYEIFSKKAPEAQQEIDEAHAKLGVIEKLYEEEEDEMMIRLVKLRRHLWT